MKKHATRSGEDQASVTVGEESWEAICAKMREKLMPGAEERRPPGVGWVTAAQIQASFGLTRYALSNSLRKWRTQGLVEMFIGFTRDSASGRLCRQVWYRLK